MDDLDPYAQTSSVKSCGTCHQRHPVGECKGNARLRKPVRQEQPVRRQEPAPAPAAKPKALVDESAEMFYSLVIEELERLTILKNACETGKPWDALEKVYKLDLHPDPDPL